MFERIASARLRRSAALLTLAVLLGACGSSPKDDPSSQAALDKLYSEAKDDLNVGSYESAIQKLERIEGRAAGSLLAQQSMLDMAWAQFRSGEKAAAKEVRRPLAGAWIETGWCTASG